MLPAPSALLESNQCPTEMYLDYNATTPVDSRVFDAMQPFFCRAYGSPSSREHRLGWETADAVDEARCCIAKNIKAEPNEIVFTSGATESLSTVIHGVSRANSLISTIVTFSTEHAAVLGACRQVSRMSETDIQYLPLDRIGRPYLDQLNSRLANSPPALVAAMFANNEIGTNHPIAQIAQIVHRHGGLLLSDITQAVGKIPLDMGEENVDFAAFSAHKLYGPKGVGALYVRGGLERIRLEPLICGGGQEGGLRGGTLNVPGIVGFGEACRIAALEMEDEAPRVRRLRDKLEHAILSQVPDTWVNGDIANRIGNTTNIGFRGVEARVLIRDMNDIAVSTQAACSTGSNGPSHVLKAIGLSDEEAYSCIRFSLGRFTTDEEIDYTIQKVIASVRKLRK